MCSWSFFLEHGLIEVMVKTKTTKVEAKTTKKASVKTGSRVASVASRQDDNFYLLKLVLLLILGSQWIRLTKGSNTIPIPLGLIIGIIFARTEKFPIDRKIEYAILLLSAFIAFWLPIGLEIVL